MMRDFEIWSEGFEATGDRGFAYLHATIEAETFADACARLAARDQSFARYYNPEQRTFWGCRLFDNEADARKSFG